MNHSVIHSLRPGVDLKGRYYQNDTKSMKSVDKREENLKKEDIPTAQSKKIIQRKDDDKLSEVYGSEIYFLFPTYKSFQVASHAQHECRKS